MLHDLITSFRVAFAAITPSELLTKIWESLYLQSSVQGGARFSQTASHLPRLKDLDGFDTRFLAPAMGLAFGQCWVCCPFGVAAGRDALGPEVARRMGSEMDHETVRINMARAAALVCLATGIGGLELDAHDYSVMK
jgi:hypothetical protein